MIERIGPEQAGELDAYVLRHPDCHFMQSSHWGRVKQDWPWTGLLLRRGGRIRGSMALLEHRGRGLRLLYAPRGPIFDDLDAFRELICAARALALERRAALLRIDPRVPETDRVFAAEARALGFSLAQADDYSLYQPRLCYVTDLLELSPQSPDANYHRSVRYHARLAGRRGLEAVPGGPEDLPDFCRLLALTGRRRGFAPRDPAYFARLLEGLGELAQLWLVRQQGRAVAAALTVCWGSRLWLMHSCSDPACLRDHPNELLQLRMQSFALERGCRWFDLRGVEGYPGPENPKDGLHRYKQSLGADFRAYLGQLDLVLQPCRTALWRRAGQLRGSGEKLFCKSGK